MYDLGFPLLGKALMPRGPVLDIGMSNPTMSLVFRISGLLSQCPGESRGIAVPEIFKKISHQMNNFRNEINDEKNFAK